MHHLVHTSAHPGYDARSIEQALPAEVFAVIEPAHTVVLKPNWVAEAHKSDPTRWEELITHPAVLTAVLRACLARLGEGGRVIITDGPTTEARFAALLAHYPVETWEQEAAEAGVALEIIDLREDEWTSENQVIVERKKLPGDPRGKVVVDLLDDTSEFFGHARSKRGYYGADYDLEEVNRAHDGHHNLYSVSRSVMEADVFINLPKLKTHRKAGITCCLKNLVGINTYKNYLPHHSEGGPSEGGDQFPVDNVNARIEGPVMAVLKQHVLKRKRLARAMAPFNQLGRRIFGQTDEIVRSGNWYGNDTIWRMILDLNKVLLYANPDGSLRPDDPGQRKHYIGVVDAILGGQGNGPLAPDPVELGRVFVGTDPAAIDAVCAAFMGFDPHKVPSIAKNEQVARYRISEVALAEVRAVIDGEEHALDAVPAEHIVPFEPHFGWKGHIEDDAHVALASR